jgi:uncharacterized repeat protein (TIGR01451 family)
MGVASPTALSARIDVGIGYTGHMYRPCSSHLSGAIFALAAAALAGAQVPANPIAIKAVAEVEVRTLEQGRETSKLVPADQVSPGDRLFYTLEVRNTEAALVAAPTVTSPIPEHMEYVADSAVGPGAEVSFSVDGGRSFDVPEKLKVRTPEGSLRPAVAADYTHIRWQLKKTLKGNAVAFVRFRALVKH